ncbi:hypothetical protein X745_30840 [Mesorhizobium sp. LNJC374B00]|nr:hypothetical protein X745_30840 [Mesorhizobium sp. LNJC374B00]
MAKALDDPEATLPPAVVELGRELLDHLATLDDRIAALSDRVKEIAKTDDTARRLMTIPAWVRFARPRWQQSLRRPQSYEGT